MPTDQEYRAAHQAVRRARKSGKLPEASEVQCAFCGEPAQEWHHHKGYAREHWLDVIPLCIPCHSTTRVCKLNTKTVQKVARHHRCEAWTNGRRCPLFAMEDSIYCGPHTLQAKSVVHYSEIKI